MFAILVSAGCATISGIVNTPHVQPGIGILLAGSAKVDITPPPGYPMGGHSIAGKISRGVWLRLYARTIYLEDPAGRRIALISTDLWSMPAGLADRVADLLSNGQPQCNLGRSGLVIAATHTHQSPGNFSSSPMYNAFASPLPGFDPYLFEFLAEHIALSVTLACESRREARIEFASTKMKEYVFARNRSFEAFTKNPEADGILDQNVDLPMGEVSSEYPFSKSYQAIDPYLKMLLISSVSSSDVDIAIAAFISVHPTSLTHDAEVYSSDLFGVAALIAERSLLRRGGVSRPVVAVFNGAEGDISPAWSTQDRVDTVRLGEYLAKMILHTKQGRPVEGLINYRFTIAPLAGACCNTDKNVCAAVDPVPGVATLGGAEDGRTIFYDLGWREGIKGRYNGLQGSKLPALDFGVPFPPAISPTLIIQRVTTTPRVVPIGVYTIGNLVIGTLPGEFTTVLGRRISEELRCRFRPSAEDILLVGPANEYVSYFTTPEEYEEQSYEGASTLYGIFSGSVIGCYLSSLADSMIDGTYSFERVSSYSYFAGSKQHFGINNISAVDDPSEAGLTAVLADTATERSGFATSPVFCWHDQARDLASGAGIYVRTTPRSSISFKDPLDGTWSQLSVNGFPENDEGLNLVNALMSYEHEQVTWCTYWVPPKVLYERDIIFRFEVDTISGKHIVSQECSLNKENGGSSCRNYATFTKSDMMSEKE